MINLLASSDIAALEAVSTSTRGFPSGTDDFIHRNWITNAIDCGSFRSIQWILSKGVNLHFRDTEGFTPIHSAIDRDKEDKHSVIKLLIAYGADINAHGINDWTPAHMAVVRNDLDSLTIFAKAGADFSIRTQIDNYETALETAIRYQVASEIITFLTSQKDTEQDAAANP